jgi:hypothetical protein
MSEELRITVDRRGVTARPIRLVRIVDGVTVDRQRFATLAELREWEAENPPKGRATNDTR